MKICTITITNHAKHCLDSNDQMCSHLCLTFHTTTPILIIRTRITITTPKPIQIGSAVFNASSAKPVVQWRAAGINKIHIYTYACCPLVMLDAVSIISDRETLLHPNLLHVCTPNWYIVEGRMPSVMFKLNLHIRRKPEYMILGAPERSAPTCCCSVLLWTPPT